MSDNDQQFRYDEMMAEYGTLNPHGRLWLSQALEREIQQIVSNSRATAGRAVRCGPGHEVTVELKFHVDDFPELWPWEGWESETREGWITAADDPAADRGESA